MKLKISFAAAMMALSLATFQAKAEETQHDDAGEHLISLDLDARLDWQLLMQHDKLDDSQTGFIGKYIALKAHGQLVDGLTYTWRQRFSRTPKDASFWDQTDILDLSYKYDKFDFGAGKQVVLIGGYEYDRAPINLMCPNLFVANVACYQYGVSAGYQIDPNNHLAFQISQSIFSSSAQRNLYSYNLMWNGGFDFLDRFRFETIWSVNEVEYTKGKYCNYIALGNKLVINKNITVLVDLMTRTYPDNRAFKNNTFMGEVAWEINPKWKLTGKVSYDCNRGVNKTEMTEVARGTQLAIAGAVGEWYPIRNQKHLLKVHAALFGSMGTNYNPADLMQKDGLYGSVGVTWHMNLLNFK